MSNTVTTKIRMYRLHELGDCFLLSFTSASHKSHVLLDCGSFRNSNKAVKKIKSIAKNIEGIVDDLDVVIATHQHNDHMSGFMHAKSDYERIGIQQVYLSWLDDPSDKLALAIAKKHDKVKKQLADMRGIVKSKRGPVIQQIRAALDTVVDGLTFSDDNSMTGQATQFLKSAGSKPIKYLSPGEILQVPNLPKDTVRIHVLGPPRDYPTIRSKDPRKGESFDPHLNSILFSIDEFTAALDVNNPDKHFPFNAKYKQSATNKYFKKISPETTKIARHYATEKWRTIDNDWLYMAERFALHINSYTNNTSLVLAFELVKSGRVLLFVGDAQAGNWRSWETVKWEDEKNALELDTMLRNTVFYKVGHHGSHNATLKGAFEKMTNDELVAFIPVNKEDANIAKDYRPWKMPAKNLYKELKKSTKGRIARMDEGKIRYSSNNWKAGSLKVAPLYIEYTIKD